MLSCLTTTGADAFRPPAAPLRAAAPLARPRRLDGRPRVLVTAFGILAPLNLGGFEIGQAGRRRPPRHADRHHRGGDRRASCGPSQAIAPVYGGLTGTLPPPLILILAGDSASSRSATRWRRSRPAASPPWEASTAPPRNAGGRPRRAGEHGAAVRGAPSYAGRAEAHLWGGRVHPEGHGRALDGLAGADPLGLGRVGAIVELSAGLTRPGVAGPGERDRGEWAARGGRPA